MTLSRPRCAVSRAVPDLVCVDVLCFEVVCLALFRLAFAAARFAESEAAAAAESAAETMTGFTVSGGAGSDPVVSALFEDGAQAAIRKVVAAKAIRRRSVT